MKASVLIQKLRDIATNYNTVYMWGVFGAPVTERTIAGKAAQYPSWYTSAKQASFRKLIGKNYFGFDCVCLIKGVLWGWSGDASKTYGGAKYASNGVPDIGADYMIGQCSDVSTDFSNIIPGEAVWMKGHIGIYIGDGLAVECTPKWKNKVQITAVANIGSKEGYNARKWTKHGKLPYVEYDVEEPSATPVTISGTPSTGSEADEKTIWNFLKGKGLNDFAVAGVMGNLYAESALRSNNMQNSYEKKLGYTDTTYTAAVDNGSYTNFTGDSAGYGLAQWTYWSRKQALLEFARAAKKSIGDLQIQLDFLWKELQGYSSVMKTLKAATSVKEASDIFLVKFENPADQSDNAKNKRASFGQKYYDKYTAKVETPAVETPVEEEPVRKDQESMAKAIISGMLKEGYSNQEIYQIACMVKNTSYDDYITDMAKRVIAGEYGNGAARAEKLTAEGHPYALIQQRVNVLLK